MITTFSYKNLRQNSKNKSLLIYVLLVLLFFIYQVNLPLTLIPIAGHDDGLYISMGRKIAEGDWLGTFNQFTLMKGIGLSIVLALLSIIKVPLPVFYVVLIILTCELMRRAVVELWGHYYLATALALLVMWYPGLDSTRILRDTLLTWETVLAFSCFLWFAIHFSRDFIPRCRALNSLGLILGYIFITREEGMTILLPVIVITTALILYCRRNERQFSVRRKAAMIGIFVLCIVLPWILICSINYLNYGKFIDNDFKESNFVKTLTLLQSIKSDNPIDFLPVPKDVRSKLYHGSPKFAELQPYLDANNAPLSGWQKPPCERFKVTCGDYGGPWFFWALRDAVSLAGHYKSPLDASHYYHELNREIQELCNSEKLTCNRKVLPLPQISSDQWQTLPIVLGAIMKNILLITPPPLYNMPSIGDEQQLRIAADFLGVKNFTPAVEKVEFNEAEKIDLKSQLHHLKVMASKELILKLYSLFLPLLFLCGGLSAIAFLFTRPFLNVDTLILAMAWGLPISRILLLSITTISGFGDIFHYYIGFSGPLLIVASMLSILLLISRKSERSVVDKTLTAKVI